MTNLTPNRSRIFWMMGVFFSWQALILGTVLYIKVFCYTHYRALAENSKVRVVDVPGSRGKILDTHLENLAVSLPMDSVFAYTPEVKDKPQTARILSEILQMDAREIQAKLEGEAKFRYIKRFVEPEMVACLRDAKLRGIGFLPETRRFYPNGKLAPHIIGFVNLPGKDQPEIGMEGIEKYYNKELMGNVGRMMFEHDGRQQVFTTKIIDPPRSGNTLIVNIDSQIQNVVQRVLADAMEKRKAAKGMVVVMDPYTGAILALANQPDYDPCDRTKLDPSAMRNYAIEHYFEPGSTFKIVSTSGALEEGLTRPDEVIFCNNGSITINRHVIRDHKPFGNLTFSEILAKSSDVGAIKLGMRLGNEGMYRYMRLFGFGSYTGVDLPAEMPGYLRKPSSWSGITIGAVSMGQEVGVTAMQLVQAMSAVANGGYLVRPRVADRLLDESGNLVKTYDVQRKRIIKEETAREIRQALAMVVDTGTGKRGAIPGYTVAGKTGTAQKFDFKARRYSSTDYVASFVGFAPVERPAFVVAVIFDSPRVGYHGGDVSAPVFSEIARQLLLIRKVAPVNPLPVPANLVKKNQIPVNPSKPVPIEAIADTSQPILSEKKERIILLKTTGTAGLPDFKGMSVRQVFNVCARLQIRLLPVGSGTAVSQQPCPGTPFRSGMQCQVQFAVQPDPNHPMDPRFSEARNSAVSRMRPTSTAGDKP